MSCDTAQGRWDELDADRQTFIRRCERYSMFTVPKICPMVGYTQNNDELQHDYQSLGAQAINHLANKMMLALFAPSRPFFRLDPSDALRKQMQAGGVSDQDLAGKLSQAETTAIKQMDKRPVRPKMYDVLKHLPITGNCLLVLGKDTARVLGIKNYVVQRGVDGKVIELVTKECVNSKSLAPDVIASLGDKLMADAKGNVDLYHWVKLSDDGKSYTMTQWVCSTQLEEKFNGKWPEAEMPYRALTWDLASGDHYGTGLVEDYAGDFAALSAMSKATVEAAILASEFRWLVNPNGMTRPEEFEASENGAALPGAQGDITLIQSGKQADLQTNLQIAQMYINRIGAGFLLQSAVTRNAERVTAEEIRMVAEELENSLGGAYSRIAVDIQTPMARWLLKLAKVDIGADLEPTIVTGLAALSRTGDRDNLVMFLQDSALLGQMPPQMQDRLKVGAVLAAFAAARGLDSSAYVLSEDEYNQMMQQRAQQQAQQQAQQAGVDAAVKNSPEATGQPTQGDQ